MKLETLKTIYLDNITNEKLIRTMLNTITGEGKDWEQFRNTLRLQLEILSGGLL